MSKKKRHWKLWKSRFLQELNGVAGVTGIGGTVMSVGGFTALAGMAGALTGGIGAVIAGGTFIYAGFKAIPPVLEDPESQIGKTIPINELDKFFPPLKCLALVGPMRSGKTTLKELLAMVPRSHSRTQTLTAMIVAISNSPTIKYVAALDGAGDVYDHQITLVKQSDYICVLMDHNDIDHAVPITPARRQEISSFLNQMRHALSAPGQSRKKWIKLVVNKKDLWEQNSLQDITIFKTFCEDQLDLWKNSNLADKVELIYHSNIVSDDINRFVNKMKDDL